VGEANLLYGDDPGLSNPLENDFRLVDGAFCVGRAQPLEFAAELLPHSQQTPDGWEERTMWTCLGAYEFPDEVDPFPLDLVNEATLA